MAGGRAVDDEETASERPVVETGGRDVVGSPKTVIAKSGNYKVNSDKDIPVELVRTLLLLMLGF